MTTQFSSILLVCFSIILSFVCSSHFIKHTLSYKSVLLFVLTSAPLISLVLIIGESESVRNDPKITLHFPHTKPDYNCLLDPMWFVYVVCGVLFVACGIRNFHRNLRKNLQASLK